MFNMFPMNVSHVSLCLLLQVLLDKHMKESEVCFMKLPKLQTEFNMFPVNVQHVSYECFPCFSVSLASGVAGQAYEGERGLLYEAAQTTDRVQHVSCECSTCFL